MTAGAGCEASQGLEIKNDVISSVSEVRSQCQGSEKVFGSQEKLPPANGTGFMGVQGPKVPHLV